MNSNTRNIVIVAIVIVLAILGYYLWVGRGVAPTPPATTTTPADTTQPATNNNTQTQ